MGKSSIKTSHRKKPSSDACMLFALMWKQPLKRDELCKRAKISISSFYRDIPCLVNWRMIREIVKETGKVYALSNYSDLDEVIQKLKGKNCTEVSLDDLAHAVGKSPENIKDEAYQLAKKYNFRIGQKTRLWGPNLVESLGS